MLIPCGPQCSSTIPVRNEYDHQIGTAAPGHYVSFSVMWSPPPAGPGVPLHVSAEGFPALGSSPSLLHASSPVPAAVPQKYAHFHLVHSEMNAIMRKTPCMRQGLFVFNLSNVFSHLRHGTGGTEWPFSEPFWKEPYISYCEEHFNNLKNLFSMTKNLL